METVQKPADPPLFGLEGHPRAPPRPGGLLRPPLRGEARPRDRGDRHARLQGGARQPRHGDHRAGRRDAGAEPELSDPSLRLHDRRRHAAPRPRAARRPVRSRAVSAGAGAGGDPLGAEAGGDGGLLPVEPDGAGLRPRLLPRPRRLREEAPSLGALRPRLCRDLFRRQPAALDPAGRGRARRGGRVHLALQDLRHARLAHGLRGRQHAG